MNNLLKYLAILVTFLASWLFLVWALNSFQGSHQIYEKTSEKELEKFFYQQKVSQSELKYKFNNGEKIKILITPGHLDKFPGTQFGEYKEVDLNRKVSNILFTLLNENEKFEARLLHNEVKSDEEIFSYASHLEEIEDLKTAYQKLESFFKGERKDQILNNHVYSNTEEETINTLYGINFWLNENDFDIVINVHFNNYTHTSQSEKGEFEGFSIYVPREKYSNGAISKKLAEDVYKKLDDILEKSNLEREENGIIEDNDSIIALGSFNTLSPASILIEYGFIYEDKFIKGDGKIFYEVAEKTYEGILEFFK